MAAVICRVVAFPVAKTEYLSSPPEQSEQVWSEKPDEAYPFAKHSVADQVAQGLRESLSRVTDASGLRCYTFIHARTIENHEWDRFHANLSGGVESSRPSPKEHQQPQTPSPRVIKEGIPRNRKQGTPELKQDSTNRGEISAPPAQKNSKKLDDEFAIKIDPRRLAEIRRDPVEAY